MAHPVWAAFIACLFTWGMTALGAGLVFFFREVRPSLLQAMLGFAAGVMISASFFSLLIPSIDMAEEAGQIPWLTATFGFLLGCVFLWATHRLLPHMHPESKRQEGPSSGLQRSILLVFAMTIHNIPEGLAVGVAFGAAGAASGSIGMASAAALAMGIGLQNFPEGAAVSLPLRREGVSRKKAFFYGQLSGAVEPISAVIGAWAVLHIQSVLPLALAFAAGAMMYVVVEELIPEAQNDSQGAGELATMSVLIGMAIMMTLDVALG